MATLVYIGHYNWIFPTSLLPAGLLTFFIGEGGQRCVHAFFIISGFLMFRSFERSGSVLYFYEKRFRRIIPGYAIVIIGTTIVGACLTNLQIKDYLSTGALEYVGWNLLFLNFVHPELPGVFTQQPIHYVNGALWTLKIEVAYYILFPVMFGIGRRVGFIAFFSSLCVLSMLYVMWMTSLSHETGRPIYSLLEGQLPGQLSYFMGGALVASWRRPEAGGALPIVGATFVVAAFGVCLFGVAQLAELTILTGVVLGFCLWGPKLGTPTKFGDSSYGIYIVHFPILQAARALHFLEGQPVARFFLISAVVFGLSMILWRFIEEPALNGRWNRGSSVRHSPEANRLEAGAGVETVAGARSP